MSSSTAAHKPESGSEAPSSAGVGASATPTPAPSSGASAEAAARKKDKKDKKDKKEKKGASKDKFGEGIMKGSSKRYVRWPVRRRHPCGGTAPPHRLAMCVPKTRNRGCSGLAAVVVGLSAHQPRPPVTSAWRLDVFPFVSCSIQKELAEITLDPPSNCCAGPKEDNLCVAGWLSHAVLTINDRTGPLPRRCRFSVPRLALDDACC